MVWATKTHSSRPTCERGFQSLFSPFHLPLDVDSPWMAAGVIRVQFPLLALGKITQVNLN